VRVRYRGGCTPQSAFFLWSRGWRGAFASVAQNFSYLVTSFSKHTLCSHPVQFTVAELKESQISSPMLVLSNDCLPLLRKVASTRGCSKTGLFQQSVPSTMGRSSDGSLQRWAVSTRVRSNDGWCGRGTCSTQILFGSDGFMFDTSIYAVS